MEIEKPTLFDRPLAELLKLDWEKVIYLAIFLIAVVSRFWDLGARAMSHDESLHALYSYYLSSGSGYTHNPMMHGPFLFHANALIYFLFGDSDYTARIVPALFGVFMVMSPLLLRRWLGRLGALVASILLLISPSILYYSRYIRNDIYITVWTMLLIAALFQFIRTRKPGWFFLGAAALILSLTTKENAFIFGFIGLVFIVEAVLWQRLSFRSQLWLYLGGLVLGGLVLAAGVLLGHPPKVAEGEVVETISSGVKLAKAIFIVVGGSTLIALLSASLIRSRHPRRSQIEEALGALSWQHWLLALVVMFLIYALLFTTFFTNPVGILGAFSSISYWLAQQEVERGGQPWYYYFLVLTMYEFVPFLFSLVAIVYYMIRGATKPTQRVEADGSEAPLPSDEGVSPAEDSLFLAFLVFWTLSSLFIYSWAGEKMPWLVVHPALPMIVLTAKFAGDLLSRFNWRVVWRRGGAGLALLLPVTLFGLYTLLSQQPLQGLSLSKLRETGNWFAALLVTLLLLGLTWIVARRLGLKRTLAVTFATALISLSFFTVRFAWMAAFINYDYATELLVYAHGAPGATLTMNEIAEISERTVGDKMIEVAYDQEVSWPLEWYMREYPNRKFYGDSPSREELNVPLVLASERVDDKVQPYLGDRYYRFKRRLVWWPNQQYMDLTWQRVKEILTSPEQRQILWNILYRREYPRSTDDWYHVHKFYFYVRKDVAQQLWDFGAAPLEAVELAPDPYLASHAELNAVGVLGTSQAGTEPGQFNHPRGVAIGPEGEVYVVDSDNHRVQVFNTDGAFLREWGSQCSLESEHGCVDPDGSGPLELGDGQFQEPWGIAVGPDGRVYVADTWNHRVQAFDSQGNFLTKWGSFGQTTTAPGLFYGPRDVAVSSDGQVYVTDTGNKRVMVFDQDGNFLDQWGGGGIVAGFFEEPVGIGLDPNGDVYVADTWNRRVQVFTRSHTFRNEWPVEGWYGESVTNKPFLAVDQLGRVYVTDPEGYLVIVFDSTGELLATLGGYGTDPNSFTLPADIAIDDAGYIYVADTNGQRVIKFEPLP